MRVQTAIRASVEVHRGDRKFEKEPLGFRSLRYGDRVLVIDTETTDDLTQRLLFGFSRIYVLNKLQLEVIIYGDDLTLKERSRIGRYAAEQGLRMFSRPQFIELFYSEVYELGTLCVFFNGPFDLTRLAIAAVGGRGRNRRKFWVTLSENEFQPRIHIEAVSGKGAFIAFARAPMRRKNGAERKPWFKGRFLDLSTPVRAFTGERHTLLSAGRRFGAFPLKSKIDVLGVVTPATLAYGRNDVHATWALYETLRDEYQHHPFASIENERNQPSSALPITRILSSASLTKQYMKMMGFAPYRNDEAK